VKSGETLSTSGAKSLSRALEKLRRPRVRSEGFIAIFKLNSAESLSRSKLISLRKSIFDWLPPPSLREAMAELAAHPGRD
jgi:hypothetical protein